MACWDIGMAAGSSALAGGEVSLAALEPHCECIRPAAPCPPMQVVNRDPVAAQIAHMRQQMAALRAENQSLK